MSNPVQLFIELAHRFAIFLTRLPLILPERFDIIFQPLIRLFLINLTALDACEVILDRVVCGYPRRQQSADAQDAAERKCEVGSALAMRLFIFHFFSIYHLSSPFLLHPGIEFPHQGLE